MFLAVIVLRFHRPVLQQNESKEGDRKCDFEKDPKNVKLPNLVPLQGQEGFYKWILQQLSCFFRMVDDIPDSFRFRLGGPFSIFFKVQTLSRVQVI